MKPLLKYPGGKLDELVHILPVLPTYKRYVEPFIGGGALYFFLAPDQACINDLNSNVINFYKTIRDDYELFMNQITKIHEIYLHNQKRYSKQIAQGIENPINENEALYYALRNQFNGETSDYLPAVLYYFINKTAYGGLTRYNNKGRFNVPFGRYASFNIDSVSKYHSMLLQNTQIQNQDYSSIFEHIETSDFMFLDPPYDCKFHEYGNQEIKDADNEAFQRRLASDFKNLHCSALMVVAETPLIKDLYANYIFASYQKKYAVNIKNRFNQEVNHLIIKNY